jgi:hypothetical protein
MPNSSRRIYEILVHYKEFLVKGARYTALADIEPYRDPCTNREDIQINRITCNERESGSGHCRCEYPQLFINKV